MRPRVARVGLVAEVPEGPRKSRVLRGVVGDDGRVSAVWLYELVIEMRA